MLIIKIALGLLGLGIVVFFHELGHFLAARLMKIDVEAFSIGWGNPIIKKKIGSVEYRLGMFPVGGYCKMKGEHDYNKAWEDANNGVKPEKGTYQAATPAARMLVCFAGPFFNLVLAVLLLSFLWGFGFEINTLGNKIILASEITSEKIYPADLYPADIAGFQTGDRITEINGREINYYHEIQEIIALNPDKELPITVQRGYSTVKLNVTPSLDKSSGAGKIGVYFWIDPVIESVKEGSLAQKAGLMSGDKITSANGNVINNTMDIIKVMEQEPEILVLEYNRNGITNSVEFTNTQYGEDIGLVWNFIRYRTPNLSFPAAIAKGVTESWKTLTISVKSLRLLFMGIDLTQAVTGPVRITYMMGDMAAQSFSEGFGSGLRSIMDFIALISIALCVMNLLPIPIVDGGMIILFLIELIRRKPSHPKFVSVFQATGMVFIAGLMVFALFGDIMFFIRG